MAKMTMKQLSDRRSRLDVVIRKCPDCGQQMRGSRQTYQYTECGLKSVGLSNVLVFDCECGSSVPELRAIEELHCLIAISILQKKALLAGDEIRYLRKMAGLTQGELAEIMGTDKTRPSKWESGGLPIGKENDRVLRSCCLFGMIQQMMSESDPVAKLQASAEIIRKMDVKEIFRQIDDITVGPKQVRVEEAAIGTTDGPWFLPDQPGASSHVN